MWLILIVGLFLPRLVTGLLYFLSNWFTGVFETWYWPILGFIFMPYTLLWYSIVSNWFGGVWGPLQFIILLLTIIADISSNAKGADSY